MTLSIHLTFMVYVTRYFSEGHGQPCPTQPRGYRLILLCDGTQKVSVGEGFVAKVPGSAESCCGTDGPSINCSAEITAEPGQRIVALSLTAFMLPSNITYRATITFSDFTADPPFTYSQSQAGQVLIESKTNKVAVTYRGPAYLCDGPFINITASNINNTSTTKLSETFSVTGCASCVFGSTSELATSNPSSVSSVVTSISSTILCSRGCDNPAASTSNTPGDITKWWIIAVVIAGCVLGGTGILIGLLFRRKYLSLSHQLSGTAPSSQQTDRDQPYEEFYNGQVRINLSEPDATNHISAFGNPTSVLSSSVYIHLNERSRRDNHVYGHIEAGATK